MMKNKEYTFADKLVCIMLMIVVGIMPLIVRFEFTRVPPELIPPLQDQDALVRAGLHADVFTYWKSWFLFVPAIAIALYTISDLATRGKRFDFLTLIKKPQIILLLVYLFFMIISALVSSYSRTSWFGTIDRGEGVFTWLAYFTVFIAAMLFVREPKFAKPVIYAFAFSSIIMGAIGVSQFLGYDFFDTAFASWIVTVGTLSDGVGSVFTMAHGTLFNPNTFGKYTAMASPVLLLAALTYDGKKYVNMFLLLAGGLMLLGVFGSSSLGGLVGIVTAAGVLGITWLCRSIYQAVNKSGGKSPDSAKQDDGLRKNTALWLTAAGGGVIVSAAIAVLFVTPLNDRVNFLFNRLGDAMRAETTMTNNYIFEGNTLTVYRGEAQLLSLGVNEDSGFTMHDSAGNPVPAEPRTLEDAQANIFNFAVPGYRTIRIEGNPSLFLYHHRTPAPFALTLQDGKIYGTRPFFWNMIDFEEKIPAVGFYGRETWGSNRGYIWSRTLPLLPRRTVIGSGPDTFTNVFPQHEIVAKQRFFQNPYILVDKAHNLFLQTWITTGGISAIVLFSLFGYYLFTTFMSLVKSKNEQLFSFGLRLGLLTGISAFVMSSMATDSTIGSTGVFFVLLGVGYGMNAFTKKPQATQ